MSQAILTKDNEFGTALRALRRELKAALADGVIRLEEFPPILMHGMTVLATFNISKPTKRSVLIQVLQEISPVPALDALLPPLIDAIWPVMKLALEYTELDRACCSQCVVF